MKKDGVIAIDGPSGSGKTTVGEMVAKRLSYVLFDTGVLYRTVTLAALERGLDLNDEAAMAALARGLRIEIRQPTVADGRQYTVLVDGRDVTWEIRSKVVDENVSVVSAYPSVREALKEQQRQIARKGRVVMVGRDIGTVIVPQADLKLFITASDEERAARRYRQLAERGTPPPLETVLADVRYRDRFDSSRAVAPLKPASDAVIIDTTGCPIQQVMAEVERLLRERGFLDDC